MTQKQKTLILDIISFVLIAIILIKMADIYLSNTDHYPYDYFYTSTFTVGSILIGFLIEHRRIIYSFQNGFSINWVGLILSLCLIGVLFLSEMVYLNMFGLTIPSILLFEGMFRSIIGLIGSICLVRSITKDLYSS